MRRAFDLLRRRGTPDARAEPGRIAADLRAGAHQRIRLPDELVEIPGMISGEERQLLMFAVEHAYAPGTQIIDGGSFLGASTRSLLAGLARSPRVAEIGGMDPDGAEAGTLSRPPIDSFDLFRADEYMCAHDLDGSGLSPGDSFRSYYEAHLGPARHHVRVHEGDIRASAWQPAPISVLFLAAVWSWDINRWVMAQFYTRLVPEQSLVIHQDYVCAWYPWIPVCMEYFCDHFEFVAQVPLAMAAFRCIRPLDPAQASVDLLEALPADELVALMDRALARFTGWPRGVLECSKAQLLRTVGREADAREHLARVRRNHAGEDAPIRFAGEIEAQMERGEPPRNA